MRRGLIGVPAGKSTEHVLGMGHEAHCRPYVERFPGVTLLIDDRWEVNAPADSRFGYRRDELLGQRTRLAE